MTSVVDARMDKLKATCEKLQAAQIRLDADPGQQRINLTDLDCRDQKVVGPGYNGQIAVDCATQIIVAAAAISFILTAATARTPISLANLQN